MFSDIAWHCESLSKDHIGFAIRSSVSGGVRSNSKTPLCLALLPAGSRQYSVGEDLNHPRPRIGIVRKCCSVAFRELNQAFLISVARGMHDIEIFA